MKTRPIVTAEQDGRFKAGGTEYSAPLSAKKISRPWAGRASARAVSIQEQPLR